jgi:hypothetical protein
VAVLVVLFCRDAVADGVRGQVVGAGRWALVLDLAVAGLHENGAFLAGFRGLFLGVVVAWAGGLGSEHFETVGFATDAVLRAFSLQFLK